MEIEFSLNKAELIEHMKWRSEKVAAEVRGLIWAPKVFFWTALFAVLLGCYYLHKIGVVVFFAFLAGLWTLTICRKWYMKSYHNFLCSEVNSAEAFAPQKLIVTKDALIQVKSSMTGEFLWNGIKDIVHTSTATFILMRNRGSLMIPHRFFKDANPVQEFMKEVNARWRDGRWESKSFLRLDKE